jgi:hypothetical protein
MPQSIPPGLTQEHVLRGLADLDAGVEHPFGPPTGYELVHGGKRYPPKAAVGLACFFLLGRRLNPEEFSGGEAPGQANFVLRRLGFTVVRRCELVRLLSVKGGLTDRGTQARLARELGVSRSTVCRDMALLLRGHGA